MSDILDIIKCKWKENLGLCILTATNSVICLFMLFFICNLGYNMSEYIVKSLISEKVYHIEFSINDKSIINIVPELMDDSRIENVILSRYGENGIDSLSCRDVFRTLPTDNETCSFENMEVEIIDIVLNDYKDAEKICKDYRLDFSGKDNYLDGIKRTNALFFTVLTVFLIIGIVFMYIASNGAISSYESLYDSFSKHVAVLRTIGFSKKMIQLIDAVEIFLYWLISVFLSMILVCGANLLLSRLDIGYLDTLSINGFFNIHIGIISICILVSLILFLCTFVFLSKKRQKTCISELW